MLIAAGFLSVYWHVIASLVADWTNDDNYSHGFLIVPIAAYFAWERRTRVANTVGAPTLYGAVLIAASFLVLAVGVLGSEAFITRISMLGTLAGILLLFLGWQRSRVLAFPLLFLLLMVPLPALVFNEIAFPLQLLASRVGEFALNAFHIPVLREGNVLVLANTTLEVAEACSGIRSLVSLLTLGIVFGYLSDPRGWVRTTIALSAIPVAVIANGVRVAGTGIAAHQIGPAAAEGFFHTFSGWVVFIVAFLLMLGCHRLLTRLSPPAVTRLVLQEAA